jgi:hypothetical protein
VTTSFAFFVFNHFFSDVFLGFQVDCLNEKSCSLDYMMAEHQSKTSEYNIITSDKLQCNFQGFQNNADLRDPRLNISSIACIGIFFTQSYFSIIAASLINLFMLISQVLTIFFV